MTGLYQVYERGQTHFQIGDNTNIFDWTYVGNVARAHLLAADKLETPPPSTPLAELEKVPASLEEVLGDLPPSPNHTIDWYTPGPNLRSSALRSLRHLTPQRCQARSSIQPSGPQCL